jgi:hypothetical protein
MGIPKNVSNTVAPSLFKRRDSLTDVWNITGSSILANGY